MVVSVMVLDMDVKLDGHESSSSYPVMSFHILERPRFNILRASSLLGDKGSRDRYNVELILRCIGLCLG